MSKIIEQDNKKYFINGYDAYEIPDTRSKAFFKGKLFNFRDNIQEFLKSENESCIIPVYCTHVSESRGFKRVTIITETEEFKFTNSEKGQFSYYRNQIKDIQQGCVYLIFLEKFARARNDCLIKAAMKVERTEKIEVDDSPCECFIGTNVDEMIKRMDEIYEGKRQ